MNHLPGFCSLAHAYDGFVLDLWGVIHDGVRAFPHAIDCLERLRSMGKQTLLLSNAPRPNEAVRRLMRGMGISDDLYTSILTSGETVRCALRSPPDAWWGSLGRRVFLLGPERDRPILEGLALTTVSTPSEADFVLNTGPDDRRSPMKLEAFEGVLLECLEHGLRMVCANPDLEVVRGGIRVLCAGSLALRYQALGGEVRSVGKPDPAIYEQVLELLGVSPDRVLAVGDSLRTDVAGAARAGLPCCWVLGGVHGERLLRPDGTLDTTAAEQEALLAGLAPMATVSQFVW